MRLTLRTLLAYLDDTLEPAEIKQIGQKVAESDAAQELIARLKQVTRRRRLTTPSDAAIGDKFDPNMVAAYLDNELSSEHVAEIEKMCLDSDVHLAEIAACHQILTLVLGEPALVPPTAKERMYGLVKGREAIPYRKAPSASAGAVADTDEHDDAMQSVLDFHRQQSSWRRWILPAAGVLLFLALPVVLIVVLMRAYNPAPRDTRVALNTDLDKSANDKELTKDKDVSPPKDNPKDTPEPPKDNPPKDNSTPKDNPVKDAVKDVAADKDKPNKENNGTGKSEPPVERPAEPSKERAEVATYSGPAKAGSPSILVQQQPDQKSWKRAVLNSPIYSSDELVSLPGYASEVLSKKGVRLQLWGLLPELSPTGQQFPAPYLYESAVVLHSNPKFDLELTLHRGRVFITNNKESGPAHVRLRFEKEIWDLTLAEPGSEFGVDLIKLYTPNIDWKRGEEPVAVLKLTLLQGKGGLRANYVDWPNLAMPGPAHFDWDSVGPGVIEPRPLEKPLQVWSRDIPVNKTTNDVRESLEAISKRLSKDKPVKVMFNEVFADDGQTQPLQRYISICGLCALDDIPDVLDKLENQDPARASDRGWAILLLRRWVSRGEEYNKLMYDKTKRTGFLFDKTAKSNESEIILGLLHDFDEVRRKEPETFDTLADYLTYNRMSIRELAYWHLVRLSIGVKTIPEYNASWPPEQRERASKQWKAMVQKGELPPPLPIGGPAPPPPPK